MLTVSFIGFTLKMTGEVLVGYTAIRVHYRFRKEHKIDADVFSIMKKEQVLGIIGIGLIIVGYLLHAPSLL